MVHIFKQNYFGRSYSDVELDAYLPMHENNFGMIGLNVP